jgi:DNA topoisomerase-3
MQYEYETVFLTEKDSQVQALSVVTDAIYEGKWKPAYNEKEKIALVPLQGHVLVGLEPKEYDEKFGKFGEDSIYIFPEEYKLKPSERAANILNTAVKHLKKAKKIIIATDFDNEGAAIAMNVIKYAGVEDRVERMLEMGSTHPIELKKSIDNPIDIPYEKMALAGSTRSFIDWVEGMSFSRALTYYLGGKGKVKLNFGGVKTPLVYIVVQRQLAYENHEITYYWTVTGYIKYKEDLIPVKMKVKKLNEKNKLTWVEKFDSESEAKEYISKIKNKELEIETIQRKDSSESPPKLYELAGLQADMSKSFKSKPIKTMEFAQKLYDFPVSIQTYPRTDVPYLKSAEYEDVEPILKKLKKLDFIDSSIIDSILSKKIPKRSTTFNDKAVVAHGAIIPTLKGEVEKWIPKLDKLELEVFKFVSKRYISNFMENYEYISITGNTKPIDNIALFFSEHIPKKSGWKKIYEKDIEDKINDYETIIPEDLSKGDIVSFEKESLSKKETKPKPLFTMDTLLKAMEKVANLYPDNEDIKKYLGENGIGTNATRATIIDHLMDPKKNKGEPWLIEEKNKIKATEKAINFITIMPTKIISPVKRALLSKKLKEIETGELEYEDLINEYRKEVKENIALIKSIYEEKGAIAVSESENISLGICPKCKKGNIIEKNKVYLCDEADYSKEVINGKEKWINNGCTYTIFKSGLSKFGKAKITPKEVSDLLNKGKVRVSLKSMKTGKAYSKDIKVNLTYGIEVDFNSK